MVRAWRFTCGSIGNPLRSRIESHRGRRLKTRHFHFPGGRRRAYGVIKRDARVGVAGAGAQALFGDKHAELAIRPILIRSRLLNPASISSRLFFVAFCRSFSRRLSLFEIYAIAFSPLTLCSQDSISR